MWRSIAAILVGFALTFVLAMGLEAIVLGLFHKAFVNGLRRGPVLLGIVLVTTEASVALGCYFAAWIAGRRPILHAMILGVIGLSAAVFPTITYWGNEPIWYHVCVLGLILPAGFVGGLLRSRAQAVA